MSYPADRKYTKDHEWIRLDGEVAEIGITDFAQDQLGDVVFVELPDPGRKITAGESFGSIESVKAVSELYCPVSGQVTDVNTALVQKPEAVNTTPHESWMIALKPSSGSALANWMRPDASAAGRGKGNFASDFPLWTI